ncbi:MAG: protein translocase subunit SecF [Desulfovibrio sp.]|jgi:preprotein translocase subunit SecF|nr:protein translocase subunit SecF [Desulfovibrio sp.]
MGLHLIPDTLNVDFIGIRRYAYAVSFLLILAGLASFFYTGGPRYGIDFAGGAVVQVKFAQPVSDEHLKRALDGGALPGLVVQSYGTQGTDYVLRIAAMRESADGLSKIVNDALTVGLEGTGYEIMRLEMVGPKVGADLRAQALEALYYAILLISIYVSGRFERRWFTAGFIALVLGVSTFGLSRFGLDRIFLVPVAIALTLLLCRHFKLVFAIGAVVSILHDVLITAGLYALCGREFDLTTIAALLTVVGYSLNDTIIVYDRIRENLSNDIVTPLGTVINRSINQTMSRTVLTSGTTLIAVLALLIFGGGVIFDFALAVFIGVFTGTASSIFIASPILLAMSADIKREDFRTGRDTRARDADGRLAARV